MHLMKLIRALSAAVFCFAAAAAHAQTVCPTTDSNPNFTSGGNVFGRTSPQWNAYFGAKVDANSGVLCNPVLVSPIFQGSAPSGLMQSNAANAVLPDARTNLGFNALTASQLVVGAGGVPASLGSLGTTTTVLHGNAVGLPSFGPVSNSDLSNPSVTVNGATCTLGSTCNPASSASSITVGATSIVGGSSGNILYDNAGALGEKGVTGTGNVVLAAGGALTGVTGLGIRDTSAAFDLTVAATSSVALTAGRTLTFDVVNGPRTVKLQSNLTIVTDPGAVSGAVKSNGTGTFSQAACADLSGVAPSCATDATNASNISSGVLPAARLIAANMPVTPLATGTSVSLAAPREYYVCTSTCTVTPPVPAAGYEFCVLNDDNVATVITLAALGSSAMYENTARTAYGTAGTGTLVSGGAAADKVCIVGRDATHYLTVSSNGTWTAN